MSIFFKFISTIYVTIFINKINFDDWLYLLIFSKMIKKIYINKQMFIHDSMFKIFWHFWSNDRRFKL